MAGGAGGFDGGVEFVVEGSTKITLKDQIQWTFSLPWKTFRSCLYLVVFLGAIVVFFEFSSGSLFSMRSIVVFSMASLIIVAFVLLFSIFINTVIFFRLSSPQKQMTWKVSDEKVVLADAAGNYVEFAWSQVKRFGERRPGYVIEMRPWGSRWIPKRAFNEAG